MKAFSALFSMLMVDAAATAQHQGHHAGSTMGGMKGFYGPYAMSREASGTSWQPESTPEAGVHFMRGPWGFMVHGFASLVYDRQGGPRGDNQVFGPTMGMLMAQRTAGPGTLGFRTMLSLEPVTIGKDGYPLILQTGETADGRTPLIDRQHPHDLFMELAVSYSIPFREHGSVFGYVGLPGEPALGPPTFMHRFSGMEMPEAPINHHWLDSTHITFGVATAGVTWKGIKIEVSSFTGHEPDERRWNFDSPKFDSYSGRLTVNPTPSWSLQLSAGHLASPEQLEPGVDVDRFTASGTYNRSIGESNWQTTLAWGRNRKQGVSQDGFTLESAYRFSRLHSVFARAETAEKDELFETGPLADRIYSVRKLSAGYVYDLGPFAHLGLGLGGLVSIFGVPAELESTYGDRPVSFMVFVRGMVR